MEVKNRLSKSNSVLEASKMETKSIADRLMIVNKERDILQNKLKSQLDDKLLYESKIKDCITSNDKLKDEINLVRDSLSNINNNYTKKCEELEEANNKIRAIISENNELKKVIKTYEKEQLSYKTLIKQITQDRSKIMFGYGNENKFQSQLGIIKKSFEENKKNLISIKGEFAEVR